MTEFSEYFKSKRRATGLTLREFCKEFGFEHRLVSKLERGVMKPPENKKLKKYVKALNAEPKEFYGLAAEARTVTYEMSEEELVKKLPVCFNKDIDELIDLVKQNETRD